MQQGPHQGSRSIPHSQFPLLQYILVKVNLKGPAKKFTIAGVSSMSLHLIIIKLPDVRQTKLRSTKNRLLELCDSVEHIFALVEHESSSTSLCNLDDLWPSCVELYDISALGTAKFIHYNQCFTVIRFTITRARMYLLCYILCQWHLRGGYELCSL